MRFAPSPHLPDAQMCQAFAPGLARFVEMQPLAWHLQLLAWPMPEEHPEAFAELVAGLAASEASAEFAVESAEPVQPHTEELCPEEQPAAEPVPGQTAEVG